ncbi:MAG TPA: N(4)-(beta-N-acetylglucosaminyl)-L-asparaginase [Gemmatimonadaceae bacterium]|nr:N(4)-(beta-N-acetylglucosaminyl)-L-asparaginase [Gemmatimonadaceae bacterium]
MSDILSRREFLAAAGSVAASAAIIPNELRAPLPLPPRSRWASRPVIVSSANGIRGVAKAFDLIMAGADPLDAIIEGVKIQELDSDDTSVGYGGLPNALGVVQLDASCTHGPTKRAGAVGALEGIKTASEVAKCVMRYTPHVLLVGADAQRFAVEYGFKVEEMLTDKARDIWLHWRANLSDRDDYLNMPDAMPMTHRPTGTINMNAVTPAGEIASVTTTAGLAFKVPGRVGDSAIVGAGQYADNDVGAAGSTGLGELNIMACGGFTTVDNMRRGMKPTDACLATLRHVLRLTEPRLLTPDGKPRFQLNYYALNKQGEFGCASYYPARFAVHDGTEAKIVDGAHLFAGPEPS